MKLLAFLLVLFSLSQLTLQQKLKSYNINSTLVTLSGVSSGGAFGIQFHVAYSGLISSAAIMAGPPYYCAADDVEIALHDCMKDPGLISVEALWAAVDYAYGLSSIDNPANLKMSKLWLFSGTKDTVVAQGVMDKTYEFYKGYMPASSIEKVYNLPAEHSWITNDFGNNCSFLGNPYINNCNLDAAQQFLQMFYGALTPKTNALPQNFYKFSQDNYTPEKISPSDISLYEYGFAYIPSGCSQGKTCGLHISFHGCLQGYPVIGDKFFRNTGINEWAESNNIIVLYPQVEEKDIPFNPKGCWDWWGYSGADYSSQLGPQMITVKNMINALML